MDTWPPIRVALLAAALLTLVIAADNTAPASDPETAPVLLQMALFYAPAPSADPLERLPTLVARPETGFHLATAIGADLVEQMPSVHAAWKPLATYPPPDAQAWTYRAQSVPPALREQIAAGTQVLVLNALVRPAEATAANERLCRLVADLADATGGYPWDEETRNLHTAAHWRTTRVDSWHQGIPDMREHIVMDAYRDGEWIRVVTMGMRKFNQPDLAATGVLGHTSTQMGHTLNACAQHLVEGRRVDHLRLAIDFKAIRHPQVRTYLQQNPKDGATGTCAVVFRVVPPQDGDADNRLWQIDFPGPLRQTPQERQMAALTTLFGSTDAVVGARTNDADLRVASILARNRLLSQRAHFATGYAPNEHLSVKAPFHAGDQTEWMWVEVATWKDAVFTGTLINDPYYVKDLRAGSTVTVQEADIFDYIWQKPDGSVEGNTTSEIIKKHAP